MSFLDRVNRLPILGLGVSTEYDAGDGSHALDLEALAREHPEYAGFLEIGIETHSGLDEQSERWIAAGRPCTYHFLDVNLEEPADFDSAWLEEVRALVAHVRPAWLCGDAGMWHFGGREPAHMLLLPPVLCEESAQLLAQGVRRLRDAVGLEVIPENPPGVVFLGDLHLLDFFARACALADTGMLLDCAHLAIYQKNHRHDPLYRLDRLPLERVVELHVAGGTERAVEGMSWINDDHTTRVLPETWEIFEYVALRCPNLRAIVFECERNVLPETLPGFARIHANLPEQLRKSTADRSRSLPAVSRDGIKSRIQGTNAQETFRSTESPTEREAIDSVAPPACNALQRVMVRMLYDVQFAQAVLERPETTLSGLDLPPAGIEWLRRPDPRAWRADLERPGRARRVLLHEFAASLAVVAESARNLKVCDQFFQSPQFHDCIQSRGSLALTFGAFLQEWAKQQRDPRVAPLAKLETEIARLRRSAPNPISNASMTTGMAFSESERSTIEIEQLPDDRPWSPSSSYDVGAPRFRLSADHLLVETASGAAALHEEILQMLARTGAPLADAVSARAASHAEGQRADGDARLADTVSARGASVAEEPLPSSDLDLTTSEYLLLELDRTRGARSHWMVAALEITQEFFELLAQTRNARSLQEIEEHANALGSEEAHELVLDLIEDGLLVPTELTAPVSGS